jgi:hypothetical protein
MFRFSFSVSAYSARSVQHRAERSRAIEQLIKISRRICSVTNQIPEWDQYTTKGLHMPAQPTRHSTRFSKTVVRPQDLLVLTFELVNFQLETHVNRPPLLKRVDRKHPAYLIVQFPPQNIAEQAFFEIADHYPVKDPSRVPPSEQDGDIHTAQSETPTSPVESILSGSSQLVFEIPDTITEIPYTLATLLDWTKYTLRVAPVALPPIPPHPEPSKSPAITDPKDPTIAPVTAIEAPYRLIISPNTLDTWINATDTVRHGGRTELWHTRLAIWHHKTKKYKEQGDPNLTIRAIWSPDWSATNPPQGHSISPRFSLDPRDRYEIVELTSNFTIANYQPLTVKVNRLMLSSQGAWLDVEGRWGPPAGLSVEEWDHRGTMGRDHYVRVVYEGFLYPFGHRASLVKVTERKFYQDSSGTITAYLFQHMYIIVREPEIQYAGELYSAPFLNDPTTAGRGVSGQGREMPLTTVTITTKVTPDLAPPKTIGTTASFWVMIPVPGGTSATDFLFHMVGQDDEGHSTEFTAPLIFVSDEDRDPTKPAQTIQAIQAVQTAYAQDNARRSCRVPGHRIAFARSARAKLDATSLTTDTLYFDSKIFATVPTNGPPFVPWLFEADVRVPAIEHLIGTNSPITIELYDKFVQSDFDSNAQVFADLINPVSLPFPVEKSGGLVTPNLSITGLSQLFGPTGGLVEDMAAGTFNPLNFFDGSAKILGGITLADIIQGIAGGGSNFVGGAVPQLKTNHSRTAMTTTLTWRPTLQDNGVFSTNSNQATLVITARLVTSLTHGNDSTFSINGDLKNFSISFADVIEVHFSSLTFSSKKGQKMTVHAAISSVEFVGPLSFVETLQKYIPSSGFLGGLNIKITPKGLNVSYTLGLPPIGVGVFTLQDISFGAGFNLPFTPDPAGLSFFFAKRQHPFHLIVSLLGGGGFFGITVGLDGIQVLEAALEFGGGVSIDLGVADGKVSIMAGIYFRMDRRNPTQTLHVLLTGYLRLNGSLNVLGLITISVEFYMSLSYETPEGDVIGQATLTVKIEIVFFSVSVSLTVERRFHGSATSGGSAMQAMALAIDTASPTPAPSYKIPTFGDLETEHDWANYCAAFA